MSSLSSAGGGALGMVGWVIALVTACAVIPAVWVLLREAFHRVRTRRAVRRLDVALRAIDREARAGEAQSPPASEGGAAPALAERLAARFDVATLERALESMLRDDDAEKRAAGARLFRELGLTDRFVSKLRDARRWTERAHAAELLGLAAATAAVPALVEAIRDPHEDMGSVKLAAAEALARLKDPEAVPLLAAELRVVDDHASPRVAEALVRFGRIAVAPLIDLLASTEHPGARVWAARVLGRIGDPAATEPLVSRLIDRSDLLRGAAAEALGAIGDRRALQPVIQATLRDPAPQVRAHAAAAASKIAGQDAVDVLVAALSDPDYGTRLRALEAFEHIDVSDTTGLEAALHDVNPEVRRRAALALERIGFLARVIDQLTSDDAALSKRAYRDLLKLGSAGIVDSIVGYLHHADFRVRAQVASVCGELAMTRTGPILVAALDDEAWPVRASLCEAIGRLRAPGGPAALSQLLSDPEEVVREAASQALAEYPDDALAPEWDAIAKAYEPGTVPVRWQVVGLAARAAGGVGFDLLVTASRDPSERVRARAVEALAGREGAVPALVDRLGDPALEVRMAAVAALGSAATEAAFEGLVGALPGAPPDARERIAQALAQSAQGALLGKLEVLATSSSLDVRLGIAWTLGKSGDPAAVPALERLLADPEATVRASAAGALGKIPGERTARALRDAAADRDARTRAAVVNALAKAASAGDGTRAVLEHRLADPDRFVRNRAAIAIARLEGEQGASLVARAERERHIEPAAAIVAWSLIPGEEAYERTIALVADPPLFERVRAFVAREEPPVRAAFYARLRLPEPGRGGASSRSATELVAEYERVLAESHEAEGRLVAVDALSRVRHDRAVDLLADVLVGDPAESVRLRAARALAAHVLAARERDPIASEALVRAASDPAPEVALVAVQTLGAAREASAAGPLLRRLGLGTTELNDAVEEALAAIHEGDVMSFLDQMMGDDRPEAIAASLRVLERLASPVALPLLEALVRSTSALVRAAAIRAVGVLAEPSATAAVEAALEDPSEEVRAVAIDAMSRARSEGSLLRLASVRSDPSSDLRARLARALTGFTGPAAQRMIEELVSDVAPEVRASALVTLLARADDESLATFARAWPKAALDTRREVRAEPRKDDAAERLGGVLEVSTDPELRAVAISGIAALGVEGFAGRLTPALRDPSPQVRVAAVRALASVVDADVRARIAELMSDPDEGVRDAVRRAQLRRIG